MAKNPIKTVETKEDLKKFFEEVRKTAFISYATESSGDVTNVYMPETVIGLSNGVRYVINEKNIEKKKH